MGSSNPQNFGGLWGNVRGKVEETVFAADKQRQLLGLQNKARALNQELNHHFQLLGQQAFNLYKEDQAIETQLHPLCIKIAELQKKHQAQQDEIDVLKSKVYKITCPICDMALAGETAVCPNCLFDIQRFSDI